MVDVLGLGDAGIDIITKIPKIPAHDEKILANDFSYHTGGVIANFLCALAKLGTKCGFVGLLGNDEFGERIIRKFTSLGIDLSNLIIRQEESTYFCVSMLDQSGEKALVIFPTNTIFPQPDDIKQDMISGAKLLHTTGLHAATAIKAFNFAKKESILASLDLEPSTLAQGQNLGRQLISHTDILFLNTHASKLLYPDIEDSEIVGKRLLALGPKIVVLTLGERGSTTVTRDQVIRIPAFHVNVVDTTGAGDCFNAAFIHTFLKES